MLLELHEKGKGCGRNAGTERWGRPQPCHRLRVPGDAAAAGAAPYGARQNQHTGNGSEGRDSLRGGFVPGRFCIIRRSIFWRTFLPASRDRTQGSRLPSRALPSVPLPRGGRTAAPGVSSGAEIAAADGYYGKSLHSCAKQSLCPSARRFPTICSQTQPALSLSIRRKFRRLIFRRGVLKLQFLFMTFFKIKSAVKMQCFIHLFLESTAVIYFVISVFDQSSCTTSHRLFS